MKPRTNPTNGSYGSLQAAYEHFNARLFQGRLPACLLTLQRHRGAYGYFSAKRFQGLEQTDILDEIALNPAHFAERSAESVLSTLVHEMVHLWQHHFGNESRRCYHNRQWAQMMVKVGLQPTDTGRPGGKQTGQRVSHLIIPEGPFQLACRELLVPAVLYQDREFYFPGKSVRSVGGEPVERDDDPEPAWPRERPPLPSSKTKFTCPTCGQNAWAKPTAKLVCGECTEATASTEWMTRPG